MPAEAHLVVLINILRVSFMPEAEKKEVRPLLVFLIPHGGRSLDGPMSQWPSTGSS